MSIEGSSWDSVEFFFFFFSHGAWVFSVFLTVGSKSIPGPEHFLLNFLLQVFV